MMEVYRLQNQSFTVRIKFNNTIQCLTVEAGKELARDLNKVTETKVIRADLIDRLKGCAILQEIHRRADKMGVEDNGLDFTVTISADDYCGLTEVMKEME